MYVMQAFTTDFRVHWAQHPLRPEFVESTYFIYKVPCIVFLNDLAFFLLIESKDIWTPTFSWH